MNERCNRVSESVNSKWDGVLGIIGRLSALLMSL